METPAHACVRVIAALDDLVEQEAAALRNEDWTAVAGLQERIEPLVDFLTLEGMQGTNGSELRDRMAAVYARREGTSRLLARTIEQTKRDLEQTRVVRRRVAQIAPAYAGIAATRHRLQAVGEGGAGGRRCTLRRRRNRRGT
jgi:hypothetical protein